MKPRRSRVLLLALLAAAGAGKLFAGEEAPVHAGTEHVQVEGEGRIAGDAPTSFVTVIRPGDYAGQVASLADLLDRTVGVSVRSFGGLRTFATVSIRGSTAEQVVVMVDGVPLNSPMGGAVNLADIPLAGVESIEVHRGFAPASVGASSIGGVVNIVTRRGADRADLSGSLARGSYGTTEATFIADLPGGRSRWSLSGEGFATEGDFEYLDNNGTHLTNADDTYTLRRNNDGWISSLRARGEIPLARGRRVTVSGEWTGRRRGVPGLDAYQSEHASFEMQRGLLRAAMAWPGLAADRLEVEISADSEYTSQTFEDPTTATATAVPGPQDSTTRVSSTGATARLLFKPSPVHRVSLLVEPRASSAASFDRVKRSTTPIHARRDALSLVVEDEMHAASSRILIAPSARLDLFSTSSRGGAPGAVTEPAEDPSALSGRLGAAYLLSPHWSLRGNIGKFHRTPSLLELYGNEGSVVGNPGLLAEEGVNADAGIGFDRKALGPFRDLALELSVFRTDADNLIQFVTIPSFRVKAGNVGESRVTGFEASVSGALGERVLASANYTRQKPVYLGGTFQRGGDLPGRARHELSSSESIRIGRALVSHRFTYVGENEMGALGSASGNLPSSRLALTRLPARYLHDAGVDVQLPARTRLSLEVLNLFDRHVVDVARYPLPGRTIFLKLRSSF